MGNNITNSITDQQKPEDLMNNDYENRELDIEKIQNNYEEAKVNNSALNDQNKNNLSGISGRNNMNKSHNNNFNPFQKNEIVFPSPSVKNENSQLNENDIMLLDNNDLKENSKLKESNVDSLYG